MSFFELAPYIAIGWAALLIVLVAGLFLHMWLVDRSLKRLAAEQRFHERDTYGCGVRATVVYLRDHQRETNR